MSSRIPNIFRYKSGYNFSEYAAMCDAFADIALTGLEGFKPAPLLAGHIFGISTGRFPLGRARIAKRYFGCLFSYKISLSSGSPGSAAFIFSGDKAGRPDYLECLRRVSSQCDDSIICIMDVHSPIFVPRRIFDLPKILSWANCLNKVVRDFGISLDLASSIYRSIEDGLRIYSQITKCTPRSIVSFCDAWGAECAVIQLANRDGVRTATLQHGNGTEIFYETQSDVFLANSELSKAKIEECGAPEDKVEVVGPMKYAGMEFEYPQTCKVSRIGLVLDGAKNKPNNIEMIEAVQEACAELGKHCCIRLHPNNDPAEYAPHVGSESEIYENLDNFEQDIDMCVVYNSTMYTDMIYKHIPVYRFKNGKVDLFKDLNDKGFSDSAELQEIVGMLECDPEKAIREQRALYERIFGKNCGADSYRKTFRKRFGGGNE